jgi:hypothetical protein
VNASPEIAPPEIIGLVVTQPLLIAEFVQASALYVWPAGALEEEV